MSACAICLDTLKDPVALPCGHVYCHSCISDAVQATASTSSVGTCCPTCREPVATIIPNPLFVPPHLRPYILPPFRRIYLNAPASTTPVPTDVDPAAASDPTAEEATEEEKVTARLHMENAVLRQSCHAWRARANAHVAAHLGLSALVRLARDQTRILKDERDELARKYDALKRKFSDVVRETGLELEEDEEEGVLVWDEPSSSRSLDEAELETEAEIRSDKSGDVPREPPGCPTGDMSSESGPGVPDEPRGSSKRRKLSPSSLHSEVAATSKSATSIPAMVIPHLVGPPHLVPHRPESPQDP